MENENEFTYYLNGQIRSEYYFLYNELHCLDGPAAVIYYESGQISYNAYWINGKRHRTNGPAQIGYKQSGEIESEFYYINGTYLPYFQKYYSKNMSVDKIFEYVQKYPKYLEQIILFARANNLLNKNQLLALNAAVCFS